jgi:hypothetical protein
MNDIPGPSASEREFIRDAARERIAHTLAKAQAHALDQGITAAEADAAVEEAMEFVRGARCAVNIAKHPPAH